MKMRQGTLVGQGMRYNRSAIIAKVVMCLGIPCLAARDVGGGA
jgi:hypothetical protein